MKTAIFPGTFRPYTKGHDDIARRALRLFDRLVIGVGYNVSKPQDADSAEERAADIRRLYAAEPRSTVETYDTLTAELALRHEACAIVRGVRSVRDYEYERDQALCNALLAHGLETVLLCAKPELEIVSASMVRELQHFGKDVTPFLP